MQEENIKINIDFGKGLVDIRTIKEEIKRLENLKLDVDISTKDGLQKVKEINKDIRNLKGIFNELNKSEIKINKDEFDNSIAGIKQAIKAIENEKAFIDLDAEDSTAKLAELNNLQRDFRESLKVAQTIELDNNEAVNSIGDIKARIKELEALRLTLDFDDERLGEINNKIVDLKNQAKEKTLVGIEVDDVDLRTIAGLEKRIGELKKQRVDIDISTKEGRAEVKAIDREIDSLNQNLAEVNIESKGFINTIADANPTIGSFVNGFRSMSNGFSSATSGAKAFIATGVGLVITAIGLAIGALSKYFNSSREGQEQWNKIMAITEVVVGKVFDIVIEFGKAIFDLGKTLVGLKDTFFEIVDGVKRFGSGLISFIKGDFEKGKEQMKEGLEQTSDASSKLGDVLVGSMKKSTNAIKGKVLELKNVRKEVDLNIERQNILNQLLRDEDRLVVSSAEANSKLAKARELFKDENIPLSERIRLLREGEKAVTDTIEEELRLAKERARIAQERDAVSSSTIEDERAVAEAVAKVFELESKLFLTKKENLERVNTLVARQNKLLNDTSSLIEKNSEIIGTESQKNINSLQRENQSIERSITLLDDKLKSGKATAKDLQELNELQIKQQENELEIARNVFDEKTILINSEKEARLKAIDETIVGLKNELLSDAEIIEVKNQRILAEEKLMEAKRNGDKVAELQANSEIENLDKVLNKNEEVVDNIVELDEQKVELDKALKEKLLENEEDFQNELKDIEKKGAKDRQDNSDEADKIEEEALKKREELYESTSGAILGFLNGAFEGSKEISFLTGLSEIGMNLAKSLGSTSKLVTEFSSANLLTTPIPEVAIARAKTQVAVVKAASVANAAFATASLIQAYNKGSGGSSENANVSQAGGGGVFQTNGETLLKVGDNPGGKEIVMVIPIGSKGTTKIKENDNLKSVGSISSVGSNMNTDTSFGNRSFVGGVDIVRSDRLSNENMVKMITDLSDSIRNMPSPVVSVKEITRVQDRVKAKELN